MTMKKNINWEIIIKSISFGLAFVLMMLVLSQTALPNTIKSIMVKIDADIYEPPIASEWATLFGYRIAIYFSVPFLVTLFELIFLKNKRNKNTILTNLEAQFLSFSLLNSIFYLFSLDYLFKANIFSIYDSLLTLLLFIVTILFDKRMPYILMVNKEEKE